MNCCFYLAIDRLPLATVAAIEFLPVIVLAALGARTRRNALALAAAVAGVYLLTGIRLEGEPLGVAFAFANAGLFALYIVCAHRAAQEEGIDALGMAMLIALVVVTPLAGWAAVPALTDPVGAARRHRRRHQLLGDPVRVRPARDGAAGAQHLRADGVAAPRHGDGDRDRRARPAAVGRRARRASRWWWRASRCTEHPSECQHERDHGRDRHPVDGDPVGRVLRVVAAAVVDPDRQREHGHDHQQQRRRPRGQLAVADAPPQHEEQRRAR